MEWRADMRIYRKTIDIELKSGETDFPLDKFQVMNGKPINKFILPNLNFTFYPVAEFGGTGTYTTNPVSSTGKELARIEAINGAYLFLVNDMNQNLCDKTPMMLYRQDQEFFGEKGLFKDKPCIDFTQSKIWYPNSDIPTAEDGRAIMVVVEYWDVYAKQP